MFWLDNSGLTNFALKVCSGIFRNAGGGGGVEMGGLNPSTNYSHWMGSYLSPFCATGLFVYPLKT